MRSRSKSTPPTLSRISSFDSVFIKDWIALLTQNAYETVEPIYQWLNQFLQMQPEFYKTRASVKECCDALCTQLDIANQQLNKQTYFVISSILKQDDLNTARIMVDRWIEVVSKLSKHGNYFSAYAVMVALQTSYIERLYDNNKLPKKLKERYALDKVVSSHLVKKMKKHKGAKVPMTTVLSSWLVMDKQLPDEAGLYLQTQDTIEQIKMLYQPNEDIKKNLELTEELGSVNINDPHYYALSNHLLPRFSSSTAQLLAVLPTMREDRVPTDKQLTKAKSEDWGNRKLVRMGAVADIPRFLDEKGKRYAGVFEWVPIETDSQESTIKSAELVKK